VVTTVDGAAPICGITVVRSHSLRLTKMCDRWGNFHDYSNAKTLDFAHCPLNSLDDISDLIVHLQDKPNYAVLRGELVNGTRLFGAQRVLNAKKIRGKNKGDAELEFGHFRSRRGYRPKISATNAAGSVCC